MEVYRACYRRNSGDVVEMQIKHGSSRGSPKQGSVERSNLDVEDILVSWIQDDKFTNYSIACFSVFFCLIL